MIAYEQNGALLTPDHGYPLRLVCPGFIGARYVKWVSRLEISDNEADSAQHQRDFRLITHEDWGNIDFKNFPAINGNVINSCICEPLDLT